MKDFDFWYLSNCGLSYPHDGWGGGDCNIYEGMYCNIFGVDYMCKICWEEVIMDWKDAVSLPAICLVGEVKASKICRRGICKFC